MSVEERLEDSVDRPRSDAGEQEIVARVQRGDREAFGGLVRVHAGRAYTVAYRILQQHEDAEDVVQESFLAALDGIDAFIPGRPFGPWLLRIVVYRSVNARKARSVRERHVRNEPVDAAGGGVGISPPERSEIRARFAQALSELTEEQRLVVQLADVDGYSRREIGVILNMPSGTVRWHLHTARAVLRRVLAPLHDKVPTV